MSGQRWTPDGVLAALRRHVDATGRAPYLRELHAPLPTIETIERHHGSLSAACDAIGVTRPPALRRSWDAASLVDWVVAFYRETGRWPVANDLRVGPPRWATFDRHVVGGFTGAVRMARRRVGDLA